jgi:hypothetical protein
MKIYKFSDLIKNDNFSYLYESICRNSFWCSSLENFNDPNEFKFSIDNNPSMNTSNLLSQICEKNRSIFSSSHLVPFKNIPVYLSEEHIKSDEFKDVVKLVKNDIINRCRKGIGIACFTKDKNDYLWKEHGGEGNGYYIEIDLPDHYIGKNYHRVKYVPEKIIHLDLLLESLLFDDDKRFAVYQKIILTKTEYWEKEQEIRFVNIKCQNEHHNFDGQITKITIGSEVPQIKFEEILSNIGDHCKKNNIDIIKL